MARPKGWWMAGENLCPCETRHTILSHHKLPWIYGIHAHTTFVVWSVHGTIAAVWLSIGYFQRKIWLGNEKRTCSPGHFLHSQHTGMYKCTYKTFPAQFSTILSFRKKRSFNASILLHMNVMDIMLPCILDEGFLHYRALIHPHAFSHHCHSASVCFQSTCSDQFVYFTCYFCTLWL